MNVVTDAGLVDRYQRALKDSFTRTAVPYQRTVQAAKFTHKCRIYWDRSNGVWGHFGKGGDTRFWNPFGVDDPDEDRHSKYVRNIVQINPSRIGHFNTGGAFIVDPDSGAVFLAHSGRIGGESVGQSAALLREFETILITAGSRKRPYTIVSDLSDPLMNQRIADFVESVAWFKTRAIRKRIAIGKNAKQLGSDEYAGEITYRRKGYVATVRLHGRVFASLKRHLSKAGLGGLQRDQQRDLFFENDSGYTLFEIKTGSSPYELYTAVGQLMLHSQRQKGRVVRVLVAPKIPNMFTAMLRSLGISVITYRDGGMNITFTGIAEICKACTS